MESNNRFLKILHDANIIINEEIAQGEIKEVSIGKDQEEIKAVIVLVFPHILRIDNFRNLNKQLEEFLISSLELNTVTIKYEYIDNSVNKEYLNEYFSTILEYVRERRPMIGSINTFKRDVQDNKISFYVGSSEDKELLENNLKQLEKEFAQYGLKPIFEVIISTFELSLEEKIEKKSEQITIEALTQQKRYEALAKQNVSQNNNIKRMPKSKSPLSGKATPLSAVPATEVELIEYEQKNGNTTFVVVGEVISGEVIEKYNKARNEKFHLFEGIICDKTDSLRIKSFINQNSKESLEFFKTYFVPGNTVRVFGRLVYDNFSRDVVMMITHYQSEGKAEKEETKASQYERVELHAHTKMSAQDSVMDVAEYVQRAKDYGYKALAVTDHYNIQVLPDFYQECKNQGIKPIFGVEGALVDEAKFKIALNDADIMLGDATYVVYDIETTGLSSNYDEIIEISACKVRYGQIIEEFSEFVKPTVEISAFTTNLTSITNDDVKFAPSISEVLPRFKQFIEGCILVAHNATFDCSYIYANLKRLKLYEHDYPTIDTLQLARCCYGGKLKKFDLGSVSRFFDVDLTQHHRAIYDAMATANVFIKMLNDLLDRGIRNYNQINSVIDEDEAYKLAYPTHFTILSKNLTGKKNLYKIISDSHTKHFYKIPRVLKKFLNEHREGLLIGSGCLNGDVWDTAYSKSYEELLSVMSFYDYVEIQPLPCYDVLLDEYDPNKMRRDIKSTIKTIIKAAKELGKIVVATGDVHHLTEEDKKFREIYIHAPMIGGGIHPLANCKYIPSQHFRSTEEMLADLEFLGESAYEYVCDNTLKIAEEIEEYPLFPSALYAPKDDFLADRGIMSVADETVKMTYANAKAIYGENLPLYIDNRIKKELNSIIGNKFASIYYIAYMLVKYSTDAGYIVGSRGSVGSSLVAYFMNITEVNALAPHYYCPKCHFFAIKETDDEKIKYPLDENQMKFDVILQSKGTGFDLPSAKCPCCGNELSRNGVDIPFETFLGYDGTKTPDIDLNFSGDFQSQAHEFCRTIFGSERAFRAGTIGTIAEKTAIGYVKGYLERTNQQARRTEVERLAHKIEGVKRSTGQHPGGIVVIPKEIEYTDIIPIQYPADDVNASWRTTHFDYHKFEHNLLKLDILGHDDPTMIRHLMDYVEKYPDEFPFKTVTEIPLSDENVFKLFNGLESLGLDPSQTFGQTIGTTGIPEFGTKLAKDMLTEIRPRSIESLLKISGLAHGDGVWIGNSRDLMLGTMGQYGAIPFENLIGCRDDIMVYLMSKNVPAIDAFNIMEKVRKGKGVAPNYEKEMKEYNVPDWYIESCKLIKYMFPKAHATAYVIMALRIGWFKVYRPIYYYAGFFSRRADSYDIESMANGFDAVRSKLVELQAKKDNKTISNKEEDTFDTLLLAIEMLARGYSFKQIDVNESEAVNFKVLDDKKTLLIPFKALDTLGESIAYSIVEAREKSPFTSKRDVLTRTKITSTQFEKLNQMGAFGNLPETDQIGLF